MAAGASRTTTLDQLWHALADDSERQALAVAQHVLTTAPHLIEAVKRRIYASLPDALLKQLVFHAPNDGRIQALNLLANYRPTPLKPAPQPKPRRRPASMQRRPISPEATFKAVFGVAPQVIEVTTLRTDWELGRMVIRLCRAAEFRFWVVARDLTRRAHGSGIITRAALWERLKRLGVDYTKRHFNRLLNAGEGLFWQMRGDRLYLTGYAKLAQHLAQRTPAEERTSNPPGVREVYLDVAGSLERWEAMLYAGWVAGRGYKEDVTIARATLAKLFGRTANTLRKWEADRLGGILTKRSNIAHCPNADAYADHIPLHAQAYVAQVRFRGQTVEEVRLFWQMPNTYHAEIPSHAHRGQAGRVRRVVNAEYPIHPYRGGQCLRYLPSPEALKRRYRSLKFRLGQYGDTTQPVYVYLGQHTRSKRGVFEITASGFVLTQPNERVSPAAERRYRVRYGESHTQATLRYWRTQTGDPDAKLGHFLEAQIS